MEHIRLGDACTKIGSGSTPKGGKEAYQGGGFKLVRSQNVLDLKFSRDGLAEINKEQADKLQNVELRKGDVLLNITGDSVARSCIVPESILPARVNQHVAIIRPKEDVLNSYYLLCYLQLTKDYLLALANAGSTRNALTKQMIENLVIPAIPIHTQHKIASILSNYDTLIDFNTKRIKLLEESARELYKEWFVRMRFPGNEQTKFVKGIPEGWKYSSLQDFGRIETGKTPSMEKPEYYGGDYLFIKTPDMHDSMFVLDTTETLSEAGNNCQRNKLLPVNSIMVSCIGSTGIGAVAINAKQGHTNQQINSIILYNQEWLTWLYFTCESLKPTIEMYGATGSTMTNLSKGKFENLKVIEPTVDIIRQFNKLESPLFEGIKNLQLQNQNLAATRDRLLPRLLSGELKVKA